MATLPASVQLQAIATLETIETAISLTDIPHIKQLKGYRNYFRIRVGAYSIGFYRSGDMLTVDRIGTRGDFYKTYPPK